MKYGDNSVTQFTPDSSRSWVVRTSDSQLRLPVIGWAVVVTWCGIGEGDTEARTETEVQPVVIGMEWQPQTQHQWRTYRDGDKDVFYLEPCTPEEWSAAIKWHELESANLTN